MQMKQEKSGWSHTTSTGLNSFLQSPRPQYPLPFQEETSTAVCVGKDMILSEPCFSLIAPRRVRQPQLNHSSRKKVKQKMSSPDYERETKWKPQRESQTKTEKGRMKNLLKLSELVKVFVEKANLNSTSRTPVSFDPAQNRSQDRDELLLQVKWNLPQIVDYFVSVLKMFFVIFYCFILPLSLLYQQVSHSTCALVLKVVALFLCSIDLFDTLQPRPDPCNTQDGKTTVQKQKISLCFRCMMTVMVIISMTVNQIAGSYCFGAVLLNLGRYQKGAFKLQSRFLRATHYQKYWDLIKMLCMNLIVCHLLACVLIGISRLNQQVNWMSSNGIQSLPWQQQYIWSYYFGTTIILTIGFGDLHATNHIEALFLIPISLFACLSFSYNLSYIGNLIFSIRQDEMQKLQKLKIFGNLTNSTPISRELKSEITNFIVQQAQIKKVSNFAQEKKLLGQLPSTLRSNFLQQANKRLFNNLMQMMLFTKKTIQNLSEHIQTRICHPEEIIKRSGSNFSLIILQSGKVGFTTRIRDGSKLKNAVLERIQCQAGMESKLVCVDVLENEKINYNIKSLSYSMIYYMDGETFKKTLALNREDHEHYRQLIDRCRYRLVQFGVTVCKYCNRKHTLFECPRLHFIPYRQILPSRHIRNRLPQVQRRVFFSRKRHLALFQYGEYHRSLRQMPTDQVEVVQKVQKKNRVKANSDARRSSFLRTKEIIYEIQQQLRKMQKKDKEEFEFTLWGNTDVDEIHDFDYYFPRHNPNKLAQKEAKKELVNMSRTIRKRVHKETDGGLITV